MSRSGTRLRCLKDAQGTTFVEMAVVSALLIFIVTTLLHLLHTSVSSNKNLRNAVSLQQHARASLNFIARDLLFAGAELTVGGIPVPTAYNPTGVLYPITPAYAGGPTINGQTTDTVTIVYSPLVMQKLDSNAVVPFQVTGIAQDGSQISINTTNGNPDTSILKAGDILLIKSNTQSLSAAGYVTSLPTLNQINFLAGDPLNLNNPGPNSFIGKLSCANQGGGAGCQDSAAAFKIDIIQYYIDNSSTVKANNRPALMRRRNANNPSSVGFNIEKLQLSYVLSDGSSSNNPDKPLNIRKAVVTIVARSRQRVEADGSYQRLPLEAHVATKNLAYLRK